MTYLHTTTHPSPGMAPGKGYGYCAGARQNNAGLVVLADGTIRIGTVPVRMSPGRVALWHQREAGSYWGCYSLPVLAAAAAANERRVASAVRYSPYHAGDLPTPLVPLAESQSRSGAGQAIAAVWVVPPEGLAIVTSGYDGRRNWAVWTVLASGEVREWRATDWVVEYCPMEAI